MYKEGRQTKNRGAALIVIQSSLKIIFLYSTWVYSFCQHGKGVCIKILIHNRSFNPCVTSTLVCHIKWSLYFPWKSDMELPYPNIACLYPHTYLAFAKWRIQFAFSQPKCSLGKFDHHFCYSIKVFWFVNVFCENVALYK